MSTDSAVRAVVAFPLFSEDDRQTIESIRAKHDPEAKRIGAHFTLVFPAVLPLKAIEAHIARVAHSTEAFKFVLRRAAMMPDARGAGGHVFLIPEDGRDALAALHERLCEDVPQPQWSRGSFTPHITVAAGTSMAPLNTLAGDLNAKGLGIRGAISEIVLVDVTTGGIWPVTHFPLGTVV